MIAAQGPALNQSSSDEKNYTAHSLFSIIIIIITTIIVISSGISISMSIVALLNCLYLDSQVLPFGHFSSSSQWGRGGMVSEQLSVA